MKTQSRLLPSAARRRSLRSGFVPAVSPLRFTFPLAEPLTEEYAPNETAQECLIVSISIGVLTMPV
jgi:hypothetical protein